MSLLPSPFKRTELNGGVIAIVILAFFVAVKLAVAMETLTFSIPEIVVAVFVTEVAAFAIVITTTFAPAIARFAKLCGAAFFAGGVFPAALFARFLRHDSDCALLAFLLLALAVVFVFFALLAREEFLAFGLCAAA